MHTCTHVHTQHTHTHIHTHIKNPSPSLEWIFLHTSCWQKSSVFKVVLKQVREEACLMLWRSLFPTAGPCYAKECWPVDFVLTEGTWNRQVLEKVQTKSSGTNENFKNVSKVLRTCASKRREKDGREFIAGFDGLEASEAPAEVGKRGQVLTTWRLPGLHCSGFSEVSGEDTLGRQLEESCSNPALSSDVR